MKKNIIWTIIILLCCVACEEEFRPELDKYDNLLVVDGMLTNGTEPLIVKLSISSKVYDKRYIPLGDAEVHISDQNGSVIMLTETENGTYKAADSNFAGIPGDSYQLNITLPDGRKYFSDPCILKPSLPIDSVYALPENPEISETEYTVPGMQFFIENHGLSNDTLYYLWRLSQTYKYRSTFDIDYTWEGEYIPYPNPDSLRTCWITEDVGEIFYASTRYLDPQAINSFPLHFVSSDTKELSIRYSLHVKQLNVPVEAYRFYSALEQQNIEQGDLWAKQPIQIRGNMHRVGDESESVLGFFIVAGETQRRIFINRPDILFYYTECTPDFELRWVPFSSPYIWPIYFDDIMFLYLASADSKSCFDCRLSGGNITPPDFWEE